MADEDDPGTLRYAEYVLGVLDADARAAVAHEVATTPEAAAAVALWQQRLIPLAESLPEVIPSDPVWTQMPQHVALGLKTASRESKPAFGAPLRPWQWLSPAQVRCWWPHAVW